MERKEYEKIELRSDEIQEILSRPPHSLIRYGISIICGVILVLLIGSFFFKYPDIITGEVVITTENPPVWVVARSSGRIKKLTCQDKQIVKSNNLLAVIDNPAKTKDIEELDKLLKGIIISDSVFFIPIELYTHSYELGELQSAFSSFTRAAVNYENFLSVNLTNQERMALQKQIHGKEDYSINLQRQQELKENELKIAKEAYERENQLYKKGIISKAELETAEQTYLNLQQSFQQLRTSIINENIESIQMNESVKKLSLQYLQDKNQYYSDLKSTYRELVATLESWRQTYLLTSPINGVVTFNTYWQKDQFVEAGSKVFAIIPQHSGRMVGKILVSTSGIGKVKTGQTVNIKLNGYPYMEYGMLKARINNISLVSTEDNYTIEVELLNGLETAIGKKIEFTGELSGIAEIITDNRSLGQRLLSPLEYVWKEKFK
ncbi:multidrug resistance efflux pump [Dysgonomonas sp. PFB1-18]|uniref:HlyD family secretion protein n=1 Tax=unclassified Dysgonomonas TaxID=2630389 RepID=UPI0024749242|nr:MULTISPECIES: HlyD family efflux transporter periplasmic adaptor subunit [unclassified Dysgonomonas]MDH6311202.1 multidrug resistance efflux pump [Dysgonomonas sp. PF1-14]MDH6341086.1 multidrug resistance efflux pump [Dysgonomonas sp. PF1-16]MDH6382780.1 multidrug resistance efflux pump [Dysgonomonas sp. PFB1-18]MDH6400074.1 multidrug resistance efflux pump [Dysgonomonas sp. PF1-23]